jgi:diguanylate cyclase (GGDEF)-like protein
LQKVAYVVKTHIRSTDIFGRWGGEEFIVILPETPFSGAIVAAEKIRREIEKANINGLHVTVSVGVTSFNKGDSPEEIVKRADEAMYEAKRGGRNRVKGKE